jgi:ribosomal protein S12 methylthiotransferase accessory factor
MNDPLDDLAAALSTPVAKEFRYGTDRWVGPAQTLARVRPSMPAMGITRIAMVTGLDCVGIPVAVAIRPNSRSLATSQGKGLTADLARTSALMEAAELFHAENVTLPIKFNSKRELQDTGHTLIDIAALPRTPLLTLDDDRDQIAWIEALNLTDNTRMWLPYELVHTNYTMPARLASHSFAATSNGLASGNHLVEAVVAGLCEVVERDATTLWLQQPKATQDARRMDLATVQDADCGRLLSLFEAADVAVAVWDVTSDIDVAAFYCTIVDRTALTMHPIHAATGMGCHPNRRIALIRALTEAAQSRLTVTIGSRDDVGWTDYVRLQNPRVLETIRSRVLDTRPQRSFADVPHLSNDIFNADVAAILERLNRRHINQVAVVNLTRSDLQIPVIRVVVAGLEGMAESPDYVRGTRARSYQWSHS